MRVVEVLVTKAAFPEILGDMRQWLDKNNRPIVRFETERGDERENIRIKVQFEANDLAEAFRQSFGGYYSA